MLGHQALGFVRELEAMRPGRPRAPRPPHEGHEDREPETRLQRSVEQLRAQMIEKYNAALDEGDEEED